MAVLAMASACTQAQQAVMAPPPPPPPPPPTRSVVVAESSAPIVVSTASRAVIAQAASETVVAPTVFASVAESAVVAPSARYAIVRVFFGTDRNLTGSGAPSSMFGIDRSSSMHYGFSEVSIPARHRPGELESPSLWRLEFSQNPEEHVVLLRSSVLPKEQYFSDMAARLNATSGSVLLFVHGYNVTFEDAARRTAQMTYDLKFDGAPVFFSWPSKGETSLYPYDETEIEWAQGDLKRFLDDILRRPEARNVYIVAHSMGNRALTKSLGALLTEKPDFKSKVKEIILAAPDIDADTFKREIAPALVTSGCPITLYASADDFALQMSMTFHGYPRLGAGGQNRVVMPGVETVDATGVDASFLGHSYYGSVRPVLSDISGILHNGWRAAQRVTTLSQTGVPPSAYWTVKK
jgi:esterase/lipase superfamily enzyme